MTQPGSLLLQSRGRPRSDVGHLTTTLLTLHPHQVRVCCQIGANRSWDHRDMLAKAVDTGDLQESSSPC